MFNKNLLYVSIVIFAILTTLTQVLAAEYTPILVQFKSSPFGQDKAGQWVAASDIEWLDPVLENQFTNLGLRSVRQVFVNAKEEVVVEGQTIKLPNFKNYFECELMVGFRLNEQLDNLRKHPLVGIVEGGRFENPMLDWPEPPDHYWEHADSDSTLWWLHGGGSDYSINAMRAWKLRPSDSNVCVASLDEGVWLDHPDLTVRGDSECCGTVPDTCSTHGTGMAGLLGANRGYYNAAGDSVFDAGGMVGVLDQADIVSYNVYCVRTEEAHANQIMHAVDTEDADVLTTASWPNIGSEIPLREFYKYYSPTIRKAWQYAYLQGSTCISAGGNIPVNELYYPSNYGISMIGVGGAARDGGFLYPHISGTNMDFLAPGGIMLTTTVPAISGGLPYKREFGATSGASAILAGSVGVLKSIGSSWMAETNLVADDFYGLLVAGATDITTSPGTVGWDPDSGWGRINLGRSAELMAGNYLVTTGIDSGGTVVDSSVVLYDIQLYDFEDYGLDDGLYPVKWYRVETLVDWSSEVAYLDSTSCWGRYVGTNGFSLPEPSEIHRRSERPRPQNDMLFNINQCEHLPSDPRNSTNGNVYVTYGYRVYHPDYPDSTQVLANLGPVPGVSAHVGYGVTGRLRTLIGGDLTTNQTLSGSYWIDRDLRITSGATITVNSGTEFIIAPTDMANLGTDPHRVELIVEGTLDVQGSTVGSVSFESGALNPDVGDWFGIVSSSTATAISLDGFSISDSEYGIAAYGGQVDVDDGEITNCTVGLHLENVSGSVDDTEVSSCQDAGLVLRGTGSGDVDVDLVNVDSHDNMYGFIFGLNSDDCTITAGSSANSNTLSGIYCRSKMDIGPGVSVADNGQYGLQMKTVSFSAAGLIDGLQATGHSAGAGVSLDSLSSPELKNCVITDNFTNVVARGLSNPMLGDAVLGTGGNNWFDNAAKYDVANHVSSSGIKAENNYWGPLIGGVPKFTILGMVDIIPWLGQEPSKNENGDITGMPIRSEILSVHPNPFNPRVRIQYEVMGGSQDVDIRIFDISGRYVTTLVDERVDVGLHDVEWSGVDSAGQAVSAGVYLYRVRFGGENEIGGKFTLVK